jgi:hypothetical protein
MALITNGDFKTGKEAFENLNKPNNSKLSSTEIDFVLTKLRQANYKGVEFEMFYTVFKKLTDMKK